MICSIPCCCCHSPTYAELFLLPFQIALVLLDEVHLLNESRGSVLEAGVVSRIKMVSQLREMREVIQREHNLSAPAVLPSI